MNWFWVSFLDLDRVVLQTPICANSERRNLVMPTITALCCSTIWNSPFLNACVRLRTLYWKIQYRIVTSLMARPLYRQAHRFLKKFKNKNCLGKSRDKLDPLSSLCSEPKMALWRTTLHPLRNQPKGSFLRQAFSNKQPIVLLPLVPQTSHYLDF